MHPSSSPSSPSSGKTVTIACRLVTTDQWLVTHLPVSKPISSIKESLLALFFSQPPESEDTSPSPITFAPAYAVHSNSRRSFDRQSRIVSLYDDDSLPDSPSDASPHEREEQFMSRSLSSVTHKEHVKEAIPYSSYVLLSFSTGIILENHFSLDWYALNPHELLELHPALPGPIRLDRTGLREYAAPYFEGKVWALRGRQASKSERENEKGKEKADEKDGASTRRKRRRKERLEWRERWVMTRDGLLILSKDLGSSSSSHTISAPLGSLIALRGPEHLDPDTPSLPRSGTLSRARQARPQPRSYATSPSLSPFVPSSSFTSDSEYTLSHYSKEKEKNINKGRDKVRGGGGPPPSPYIVCAKFRIPHSSSSNASHTLSHPYFNATTTSSHDHPSSLPDSTGSTRMSPSASDSRKPSAFDIGASASWGPSVSASSVFAPHNNFSPTVAPSGTTSASLGASTGTSWWRRGSRDASASASPALGPTSIPVGVPGGNPTSQPAPAGSGASEFLPDIFGLGEMFGMRKGNSRVGESDAVKTAEDDEVAWIVLDMLNERAHSNILRILHLHAPPSMSSSFMPQTASPSSSSDLSPVFPSVSAKEQSNVWQDENFTFPSPSRGYGFDVSSPDTCGSNLSSGASDAQPTFDDLIQEKQGFDPSYSASLKQMTAPSLSPTLSPTSPASPSPSLAYSISSITSTRTVSSSRTLVPLPPSSIIPAISSPQQSQHPTRYRQPVPGLVISTTSSTAPRRTKMDPDSTSDLSPDFIGWDHELGEGGTSEYGDGDSIMARTQGEHDEAAERNAKRKLGYPEWRWTIIRRARRAGVGELGRAMEAVLFGLDEQILTRPRGRGNVMFRQEEGDESDEDSGSNSDSESGARATEEELADSDESCKEWENWKESVRFRTRRLSRPKNISQGLLENTESWEDNDFDNYGPSGARASAFTRSRTLDRLPRGSWISERSGEYVVQTQTRSPAASLTTSPSPSTSPSSSVPTTISHSIQTSAHTRALSTYASADSLVRRFVLNATPIPIRRHTAHSQSLSSLRSAPLLTSSSDTIPSLTATSTLPHRRSGLDVDIAHQGNHDAPIVRSHSPLCSEVSTVDDHDHDHLDRNPEGFDSRREPRAVEVLSRSNPLSLRPHRRSSSMRRDRPRSVFSELDHLS